MNKQLRSINSKINQKSKEIFKCLEKLNSYPKNLESTLRNRFVVDNLVALIKEKDIL